MSHTRTFLAGGEGGHIRAETVTEPLGGLEVLIRITHCGVCHTDVNDRFAGCGLGHEGVGIVEAVGQEVTAVQVGQRVGCSWQTASCGYCPACLSGYRACCTQSHGQKYGADKHGAFCDFAVRHQDFVQLIPDGLESKYAGPLMCAGITVYEALRVAETKPSDRVGIIGLGGLGHIGVMYARAMGCDVIVFSGSNGKREDALKLGATEFYVLPHKSTSTAETAPLPPTNVNVLLLCGSGLNDIGEVLPLLSRCARIVPLVIQEEPMTIPHMPFILPGHKLIGSTSATRENQNDAIQFAARHQIRPWIEEFPMSIAGLETAMDALEKGTIRYRAVLSRDIGAGIPE